MAKQFKIPMSFHPRVFDALGPELVTNDIVAIIELVKNSYDAFARRVDVKFITHEISGKMGLEISDNGTGMNREIIENVWCVVATPYRLDNPISVLENERRVASGNKGLGRLATARLGNHLELFTKSLDDVCWRVDVDWVELSGAESINSCNVLLSECKQEEAILAKGTVIRIPKLKSVWDSEKISELRDALSRLISPFEQAEDFKIFFTPPDTDEYEPLEIKPARFLNYPPYLIKGYTQKTGEITCTYQFMDAHGPRTKHIKDQLLVKIKSSKSSKADSYRAPTCGTFKFEIRVWDIDPDSIQLISDRFDVKKSTIRSQIRNYKGLSVYRDHILVLPKTDKNPDWIGLDLRRVSRVGSRIGTSQIVGYIGITLEDNVKIRDTSDRERLEDNQEFQDFKNVITQIIILLEKERDSDRTEREHKEPPFQDLFSELSATDLLNRAIHISQQQGSANDVLPLIEEFDTQLKSSVEKIERRLFYYNQLASLGVLAAMIVHEIRNRIIAIGALIDALQTTDSIPYDEIPELKTKLSLAERSITSLERLADRFAPLASRRFRSRQRNSVIEQIFRECIEMREKEIAAKKVQIDYPDGVDTLVDVDPGELFTVLLNLLDNSLYWITRGAGNDRSIKLSTETNEDTSRVIVKVDDNGPGITDGDEDRIFWPGVTRKPNGIGMGLTVASEIISQHGGRMRLVKPGTLGGASFYFDLPLYRRD